MQTTVTVAYGCAHLVSLSRVNRNQPRIRSRKAQFQSAPLKSGRRAGRES